LLLLTTDPLARASAEQCQNESHPHATLGEVDQLDVRLLSIMQENAERSAGQIAKIVGITAAHCSRRIKRLKAKGYIRKIVATLDRQKLGYPTQFFVQIKIDQREHTAFVECMKNLSEVTGCYAVLGSFDFLLRVIVPDLKVYEEFYFHTLMRSPGVRELNTCTSTGVIKMTTEVPLHGVLTRRNLRIRPKS
jgi:DNA-binding Lrp family transcriptional regulator